MSSIVSTGEDFNASEYYETQSFLKNTQVHNGRCAGYDVRYKKSNSTKESDVLNYPLKKSKVSMVSKPSQRYDLIGYLRNAIDNANELEEAAKTEDLYNLAIAGISLKETLHNLWSLRYVKEEDWQSILNFLQSALTQIEFEKLSLEQCRVIKKIIDSYLSQGAVGVSEVDRVINILQNGNFDPFRGISANSNVLPQVESDK